MENAKGAGRVFGALLLVQMVAAFTVNFVLLAPVFANPPGFLVNAAAHPVQVGVSALMLLATGGVSVGLAVVAFPVLRGRSRGSALWLLALGLLNAALAALEGVGLLSMRSLSQAYAAATPADAPLYQALRVVVAASRNWAHFTELAVGGCMILVLYAALLRFALVPRAIAILGLLATPLQLYSVGRPFFGGEVVFPLLAPLGVAQLLLGVWLAARGFGEHPAPAIGAGAA